MQNWVQGSSSGRRLPDVLKGDRSCFVRGLTLAQKIFPAGERFLSILRLNHA